MKGSVAVREALKEFEINELIFASKLYREKLYEYISEMAYYKVLERLCASQELEKIAKGVYYIPYIGKYGIVSPTERQIVEAYTKDETGTVIGYALYNNLKLTTQVPKTIEVLSSVLDGYSKTLKNVNVRQAKLEYTEPVRNMISALEVLQNYYRIQDMNHKVFLDYILNFATEYDEEIFEIVIENIPYKKSTIAFLQEVLEYKAVPNRLERYLSALSNYKHPKMEEIRDLTQSS